MRHFSPTQLHEYLSQLSEKDTAPLLLDVREPWEYEYCNIEGSMLIPMRELATELDGLHDELMDELGSYDREIIMICHHGIRSRQMGYYMEQAGFKSITNLDGGVEQWAQDVEQTMKHY